MALILQLESSGWHNILKIGVPPTLNYVALRLIRWWCGEEVGQHRPAEEAPGVENREVPHPLAYIQSRRTAHY